MIKPFIDGRVVSTEIQFALVDASQDKNIVENLLKSHIMIDRLTLALDTATVAIKLLCKKLETDPQPFYDLLNTADDKFLEKLHTIHKGKE